MLQQFIAGIALIFACLFFISRLYKRYPLTPSSSIVMKCGYGAVHGLAGIFIMFFSVQVNTSTLLDMRQVFLIAAALAGGIPAALTASAVMIAGRTVIFGGLNAATLLSAISMLSIGLGSGMICSKVESYWRKWAYSLLLTVLFITSGLFYLLGSDVQSILPYYYLMVPLSGVMSAWLLRILTKSNERTNLNELIAELIPRMNQTRSPLDLFTITLQELAALFACDAGEVILTDKKRYRTVFRYSGGAYESLNQLLDPLELEALLGTLNGKPVLFSNWNKKLPRGAADLPLYEQGIRSSVHLPVMYNGKLIAIITLASKIPGHFGHKEMQIAQQLIPLISMTMALKDAEGKFESVFNSTQDAVIVLDNDSNIELWNGGAELIYGYTAEEVTGRHISILIPERLQSFYMTTCCQLRQLGLNTSAGKTIELTALRKDGSELPVEMSLNCRQTGGHVYFSTMVRDISIRKCAEHEISLLKQELAETLRHQHGMIMKFKQIGGELVCTLADGQLLYDLGLTPEQVVGKSIENIARPHYVPVIIDSYERAWNGESLQFEYTLLNYTFLTSLNPIFEQGQVVEIISTSSDITRRKQAESELIESEERYRKLIKFLPDGIIIHCEGKVVQVNRKTLELLGAADKTELIGLNKADLVHPDSAEEVIAQNQEILMNKSSVPPSERVYIRLDGQTMNVEVSAAWTSYKGKPAIMTVFRDITVRKRAELRLHEANELFKKLSMIDGLTGIANRRHFEESYQMIWEQAVQQASAVSIMLLDIDFFKVYNDTYGHQGGDICLKEVASALDHLSQAEGYFAARYGGEEFICILPDTHELGAYEFAAKVRKAVEALAIPHTESKVSRQVTVSIGIATVVPTPVTGRSELIEQADQALYKAKTNGRNQIAS
ncbi:MAG: hypothetical protein K0S39_1553 [Paenibacillus sp.]|jgi:diguanylate cyclase (GGDEF)-like protein/PAS domain S-box-containing protein|nr:hypothetical protein [Paenibacillus sp.]